MAADPEEARKQARIILGRSRAARTQSRSARRRGGPDVSSGRRPISSRCTCHKAKRKDRPRIRAHPRRHVLPAIGSKRDRGRSARGRGANARQAFATRRIRQTAPWRSCRQSGIGRRGEKKWLSSENPAKAIERYPEAGRERILTSEELARLGDALRQGETIGLPYSIDETKPNANTPRKPTIARQTGPVRGGGYSAAYPDRRAPSRNSGRAMVATRPRARRAVSGR